jgi:hypothetical protein
MRFADLEPYGNSRLGDYLVALHDARGQAARLAGDFVTVVVSFLKRHSVGSRGYRGLVRGSHSPVAQNAAAFQIIATESSSLKLRGFGRILDQGPWPSAIRGG